MKSKSLKQNKVNIITLGCSKNLVDSEMLSGQLAANDIDVVHENKKLDHNIVVVNTCGFIDKAKEESIQTILQFAEAKFRIRPNRCPDSSRSVLPARICPR